MQDFNDKSYWAGPLLSLQKVTVAGVLVFFEPSFTQTLSGLLIAMLWGLVIAWLCPYPWVGENLCASVLNCSVSLIMVGAIASKLLVSECAQIQRDFASSVLWLSVVAAFGAIIVGLFAEWAYGDWRKIREAEEKQEEEDTKEAREEKGATTFQRVTFDGDSDSELSELDLECEESPPKGAADAALLELPCDALEREIAELQCEEIA